METSASCIACIVFFVKLKRDDSKNSSHDFRLEIEYNFIVFSDNLELPICPQSIGLYWPIKSLIQAYNNEIYEVSC